MTHHQLCRRKEHDHCEHRCTLQLREAIPQGPCEICKHEPPEINAAHHICDRCWEIVSRRPREEYPSIAQTVGLCCRCGSLTLVVTTERCTGQLVDGKRLCPQEMT